MRYLTTELKNLIETPLDICEYRGYLDGDLEIFQKIILAIKHNPDCIIDAEYGFNENVGCPCGEMGAWCIMFSYFGSMFQAVFEDEKSMNVAVELLK